jgi:hypothetical protein
MAGHNSAEEYSKTRRDRPDEGFYESNIGSGREI